MGFFLVSTGFGKRSGEVNRDAAGTVLPALSASAVDTAFGYTGADWDGDVNLTNHDARWYDSGAGRWLSQDPIGFAAGDPNLYRYVGNTPATKTDPSGLEPPSHGTTRLPPGAQTENGPVAGGAIIMPGDPRPGPGNGIPGIISTFSQSIQDELTQQIGDALANAPAAFGYVESLESYYDWIPFVNPELGGENDGPCDRWTTGVFGHLQGNNTSPHITYTRVGWVKAGDSFWSGHHAIRVEVYDPATVGGPPNTWELLGIFYIDNYVLGGVKDHLFGTLDIPQNYVNETPGHCKNGDRVKHHGPHPVIPPRISPPPKKSSPPKGPIFG